METLVGLCLISAVVVFILEKTFIKDTKFLIWVAVGFVAAAALLIVVDTIHTLVILCLIAAVVLFILQWFVFKENKYLIPIAIGCIVVAVLLIAVLNMGAIAIPWLVGAGGIISLLSYAFKDIDSCLKWIVIGCLAAAAVSMGPLGMCFVGAIAGGLALLKYKDWMPSNVTDALSKMNSLFDWFTNLFKSKPDASNADAGSPEANKTEGVFFLLCLIAAVVVVIMIWFVLKDIPVLKLVTLGCIAIAVALILIRVSHQGGQG